MLFSTASLLGLFPPLPHYLAQLYYSDIPDSHHFLASIWKYNCAFQMTSFGCNDVHLPGWNPSFHVQGQVFHQIRSLLRQLDQLPQYLQIYFIDNHCEETNTCMNITTGLMERIVNNLSKMLHQCNPSVQLLKTTRELLEHDDMHAFQVVINKERSPPGDRARQFNAPISDEIGILMPNELTHNRDVVLQYRPGQLQHVFDFHRSYDALQYPLLFPHGTDGYHIYLRRSNGKNITQMAISSEHVAYFSSSWLTHIAKLKQSGCFSSDESRRNCMSGCYSSDESRRNCMLTAIMGCETHFCQKKLIHEMLDSMSHYHPHLLQVIDTCMRRRWTQ